MDIKYMDSRTLSSFKTVMNEIKKTCLKHDCSTQSCKFKIGGWCYFDDKDPENWEPEVIIKLLKGEQI